MSTTQARYTEREGWPGMFLDYYQWRWFNEQPCDIQRSYYEFMTRTERVEA